MPNRSKPLPCLRLLSIAAAGLIATGQGAVAEPAYNFTYKIK